MGIWPDPSSIAPPVTTKALSHNEMVALGVAKSELVHRIGIAPPNIERIFNVKNGTKIETIDKALLALGKREVRARLDATPAE